MKEVKAHVRLVGIDNLIESLEEAGAKAALSAKQYLYEKKERVSRKNLSSFNVYKGD